MVRRLFDTGAARLMRRAGRPVAPKLLAYNVTDRCNARCEMCEIHTWKSDRAAELSASDFEKFIRDPLLKNLDVVRVTGGEPFLRDDLPEIYRLADAFTRSRIFYVTTNGSFPDRAAALVESADGVRARLQIQVSLDAVTDEHDRLRGVPGMKDRAVETLRRLAELRKKHDFHAGINQTVMKTTLDQIEPVHALARELGLGHSLFVGARFHEGKNMSAERPGERALPFEPQDGMSIEEIETFHEKHKLLKSNDHAAAVRAGFAGAFLRDLSEEYLNEGGRNRALFNLEKPRPPCMAMFSHFRLYPDGSVAACSVLRDCAAGKAPERSFSEIWRGERAAEIRKKVLACKGCWIECDINPSVFLSGDIIPWFIKKVLTDGDFRKRYLSRARL